MGPAAQLTGIGWFVGAAILAGVFGGRWVDELTGAEPLFTLAGVFLGLAVALVGAVRMLMQFLKNLETRGTRKAEKR
jgi:F0F1-type ATP synthase assembly protein I